MLVAGIVAVAAIVLALATLGFAALRPVKVNEDSLADRLGVVIFDLANTVMISSLARLVGVLFLRKPKRLS